MIKNLYVAECDLCGRLEMTKTMSEAPRGWDMDKKLTFCPKCVGIRQKARNEAGEKHEQTFLR